MITSELSKLNREKLLLEWEKTFNKPAPRGISQPFLRRFIAFEAQARRFGGPSKQTMKALVHIQAGPKPKSAKLAPGARLIREWNGVTHTVEVTDHGYFWNGDCYRSLSAIARAITGVHWSGPRFFGLNGKTRP